MANSAQFARVTIWNSGDILTAAALNAEFQQIYDELDPDGIGSGLTAAAGMQTTEDPGEDGSENVPVSLENRLRQIGFILTQITGKTYPYENPATSLELLASSSENLSIGLEFDGPAGGASSKTETWGRLVNQGAIINALSLSSEDVTLASITSANKKFGTYAYAMDGSGVLAFPGNHGNLGKGSISAWYRNIAAGDYIAYNPLMGIELFAESGAGKLTAKITEKIAATESTKASSSVEGLSSRSGNTSWQHALLRWRVNDENGSSTDLLELKNDNVDEGTHLTSQDLDTEPGRGGIWFFGAKRNDPSWDHFLAMDDTPDNHSSAWTENGTTNGAVTNGILNIATTGGTAGNYERSSDVDLTQQTLEWKMELNSVGFTTIDDFACLMRIRDDSLNRSITIGHRLDRIDIFFGADHIKTIFLNSKEYHVFRLTSSGTPDPTANLYIDGVLEFSQDNDVADATAADIVQFGDIEAGANNCDANYEYVKIYDAGATPPVAASSQGEIDSVGVVNSIVSDSTVSTLQTSRVSDVFGRNPKYGPHLPKTISPSVSANVTTTSTTMEAYPNLTYYLHGDGFTEFEIEWLLAVNSGGGIGYSAIAIDTDDASVTPLTNAIYPFGYYQDNDLGNGVRSMLVVKRHVIPPVGLAVITPMIAVNSGTLQIIEESANCFVRIRRREDMA